MKNLLSKTLLVLAAACAGGTIHLSVPTPLGPVGIDATWNGEVTRITQVQPPQTRAVNGQTYEVWQDNGGRTWLRSTTPPHVIVPEAALTGDKAQQRQPGARPPIAPAPTPGTGVRYPNEPRGAYLVDLAGRTVKEMAAGARLDVATGEFARSETLGGANVIAFDADTLQATVEYLTTGRLGLPYPYDFPAVRWVAQAFADRTSPEALVAVNVEGDVRDVAEYLLAQGVVAMHGVPVTHGGRVYPCEVSIDRRARVLTISFGSAVLRQVALR